MPAFKDSTQHEWLLSLDAPKIHEVRKTLDLDLVSLDGSAFEKLDNDPVLLVNTLWLLCRSQANGTTDEQFGQRLVGDAIDAASQALTAAITDFFPQGKRSLLRSLAEKNAAIHQKALELAQAKIDDPALMAKLEAAMESRMTSELEAALTRLNSASNSAASVESTPKT